MRTIFTIKAEEKKLEEEKRDTRDGTCVKDRQSFFRTLFQNCFFRTFFLKFVVFEPIFQNVTKKLATLRYFREIEAKSHC